VPAACGATRCLFKTSMSSLALGLRPKAAGSGIWPRMEAGCDSRGDSPRVGDDPPKAPCKAFESDDDPGPGIEVPEAPASGSEGDACSTGRDCEVDRTLGEPMTGVAASRAVISARDGEPEIESALSRSIALTEEASESTGSGISGRCAWCVLIVVELTGDSGFSIRGGCRVTCANVKTWTTPPADLSLFPSPK